MQIASYIDHTILSPTAGDREVRNHCEEAVQFRFSAVCIPPPFVKLARQWMNGSTIKVATVIGFPFGYSAPKAKEAEIEQAITDGVDELDIVINLIALKQQDWSFLENEMAPLCRLVHRHHLLAKGIIETGLLTDEEIIRCCDLYARVGVDFLKTSTGFAKKGASLEAVQLMRQHLPEGVRIKASGGIRHYSFARQLIEAGADRLGCSASVAIINEELETFA